MKNHSLSSRNFFFGGGRAAASTFSFHFPRDNCEAINCSASSPEPPFQFPLPLLTAGGCTPHTHTRREPDNTANNYLEAAGGGRRRGGGGQIIQKCWCTVEPAYSK